MKRLSNRYGCPVELALDLLDGKWKTVILARLKDTPMRYGELRRAIPRLSDKMLTERLHDLAALDLVVRDADGSYRLGPAAERARPVLQALFEWGDGVADERAIALDNRS